MKTKIISSILISSLLIQITLTSGGCMSYYPSEKGNNLYSYNKNEDEIQITLKDSTKVNVPSNGVIYFEKADIDSSKTVANQSNPYQEFWLKDKRKFTFKLDRIDSTYLDTASGYCYVLDKDNRTFRNLVNKDVMEIKEHKNNPANTALIVGLIFAALLFFVMIGSSGSSWDFGPFPYML